VAPFVLLGNFEVEEQWAVGEIGLPKITATRSRALVHHMDEFALLIADRTDTVVLKTSPDEDYLAYLQALGMDIPRILTATEASSERTVTEDAMSDPSAVRELTRAARLGAHLWAHGVSEAEEQLAVITGLPLATSGTNVSKRVNSKIYSRLVAAESGLRQPEGSVCRDLDEFDRACRSARSWLAQGRTVVFKDAYGVSGKGILVVHDTARLSQVERMVRRQAARRNTTRLALVMEEWLPKRSDLNYQLTVGRDGTVHFDTVKEALTEGGVHKGHRLPVDLSRRQLAELHGAADSLGRRLADDGYVGVAGIDAIVTVDDGLLPVIEINARNNMSTYQDKLQRLFFDDGEAALATQHPLKLRQRLAFADLRRHIEDLLLRPGDRAGIIVNNFGTVNAAAPGSEETAFEGRLYCIAVAPTPDQAAELDRALQSRAASISQQALEAR
jgi:hypothetical protein